MNIQDLKSNTTWQEASNTINNNNNKISLAIATLENATLKNKGYFTTLEKLNEAIPNPTIGSKAYVGTSEPYAIYIVENGAWVDSGYTGGDEIVAKITTDRIQDGAVTSEKLEPSIQSLITNISKNASFAGIATPSTNPGTPDGPVFYIALQAGIYPNFSGIKVKNGESVILQWNSSTWIKSSFKPMTDFNSVYDLDGNNLTKTFERLHAVARGTITVDELDTIFSSGIYLVTLYGESGESDPTSIGILEETCGVNNSFNQRLICNLKDPNTDYSFDSDDKNSRVWTRTYTNKQQGTMGPIVGEWSLWECEKIVTTDRIEDGAVTSEKIATSAFDSTLSVSGKIAPADVVGSKLTELEGDVSSLEGDVSSLEGDISSLEGDISSIVNGKYINLYGDLLSLDNAKYCIIQLNKGDLIKVVVEGNSGVSIISETNAEGTIFSPLLFGKGDTQQSQTSRILYIIKKTGYYAICTINYSIFEIYKLTNNCFIQLNKSQEELEGDVSSLEGDVSSLEGDVSSLEEKTNTILTTKKDTLSLTTTEGYYINLYGNKLPLNNAIISPPILLTQNDKLIISAFGNSAVSFLAKTNEEGSTYQPIVIGSGPSNIATNQTKTYTIEETGYYAFCSLNSYLEVYIEQITGGIIKYILDEISSLIPTIPEQEYSISMFEKVACCGDSYVVGQIYNSVGLVGDRPNLSWGKNIGRLEGIEINIYASSGADTNTWQTRSTCLPAALAAEPSGLYLFCMGINDSAYVTKGSMEDITSYEDYHDYPNTFYGNYGKIIEQIKAHAPNSKIIIMTPCHPSYISNWLTPITEITEYYNIAMINTQNSSFINSSEFTSRLVGGHPTAALHGALAIEIIKLVSNCINNNYNYFKDYIGL